MLSRFLKLVASSALGLGLATALLWIVSGGVRPARAIGPLYVALTGADTGNNCQNSATPCATIQRAVDVADPGDEILVASGTYTGVQNRSGTDQHVYISQTVTIRGGYTTTDWINSYPLTQPTTLDVQGGGRVVFIANVNGRLENLTLTNGNASGGNGGGILAGGGLTLTNVNVISNTAGNNGGGVYASGAVTLTAGVYQDNTSTSGQGGGLYTGGTLMLTDTQFLGNAAPSFGGGGARVLGGAVLEGGLFQGNTSLNNQGGGLYAGAVALTGTQFISNASGISGGGVYATDAVTLTGGLFQFNTSTSGLGGGLSAEGALSLANTQFLSNTARFGGGGARAGGAATLNGGVFQDNQCTDTNCFGGGLYAGGTLALTDTQFLSNTALVRGGGLYVADAAVVSGGRFEGNRSTRSGAAGGAMYANGTLTLTDTQFVNNAAESGGGGAYANGAAALSGGLFQGNSSPNGGGGLAAASSLTLTGTQFLGNSASFGGGAYVIGAATLDNGLFHSNVATSNVAGGLYTFNTLALTDTQFLSNSAVSDGGGLYAVGAAALSGGLFEGNQCTGSSCRGGGLYAASALTLTGTQFVTNTAVSQGGGAYALGTAMANGGLFAGNQTTDTISYGGGLYAASAILTGTQFLSNSATSVGGGLFGNDLVLTHTHFYSNTAASNGGGAASFGTASLQGGVFAHNQCTDSNCQGGGLYVSSVLTATGTQFVGNASAFNGGAMYLFANIPAESRLVNVLLARNSAAGTGAGIYMSGGPDRSLDIVHTTIVSPTMGGGVAIYNAGSAAMNITNTIVASYTTGIQRQFGTVNEDYNLFFDVPVTTTSGVTSGGHSLSGDPAFVNPAADDYRLGLGSAAVNAGTDAGVAVDFEGDARPQGDGFDIGYDEALALSGLAADNSGPTVLGSVTYFTATASGPNAAYEWNFGDGSPLVGGATATHTYPTVGVFTAFVTATNGVNTLTATTAVTITPVQVYLPLIMRDAAGADVSVAPNTGGADAAQARDFVEQKSAWRSRWL